MRFSHAAQRRTFLNSAASVIFSLMIIASAYFHGQTISAQYTPDGYYAYTVDQTGRYWCYVCPTPPPDEGGGEIYGCTDPNAGNYDPDATVDDGSCEGYTVGNGRNLAQSYAYDDTGYHPGSDCGDQGAWELCPGQPDPVCQGFCQNACGSSDGCGGVCGDVCTIGCASADDPNVCSQAACQSPTSQSVTITASDTSPVCGTGLRFAASSNSYVPYTLPGSVTATQSKTGSPNYNYYCSTSYISSASGAELCGSVITDFDPANVTPGNTPETGRYDVGVSWWWDVSMHRDGFMDCEAPTVNPGGTSYPDYAVYPSATSYFKSQTAREHFPNGVCDAVSYWCVRSDQKTGGPCGFECALTADGKRHCYGLGDQYTTQGLIANFHPSMVQYAGINTYYDQAYCYSGTCTHNTPARTTHAIGDHDGADPNSIVGTINGWIPGTGGTTWYVYRELNDCPWGGLPTSSGDPRITSYSNCSIQESYVSYCNSNTDTCTPAPDPSGPYSFTPVFCPAGREGTTHNRLVFSRNSTTGVISGSFSGADTGSCYPAPASLTATPLGCASKQIKLDWSPVADERNSPTRYQIKRDGVVLSSSVTGTTYTDTLPTHGTSHTYTVSVISPILITDPGRVVPDAIGATATVTGTAPQICTVSSTGFTATAPTAPSCGSNWVNIAFYDSNADTYVVKRDGTQIGTTFRRAEIDWSTDSDGARYFAFSDTGLTPGASHNYTLTLTNSGGSTVTNANPSYPVAVQQICAPVAPSGLSATVVSSTRIDLAWIDNATNESGIVVQRSANTSGSWVDVTTRPADSTSYSDTGLTAGTTYYYRLYATNAGGNSQYSNTVSAATLPTAPAAPTGFTATPSSCGNHWINIAWNAVSSATNYKVYRDGTKIYDGDGVSIGYAFSDTNLDPGSTHSYTITASNSGGTSSAATASPNPTVSSQCAAPANFTATAGSCGTTAVTLSWSATSGATSYTLKRGSTTIYSGGSLSYTDTAPSLNTSYTYTLTSNAGGGSAEATASVTTASQCPGPANFTATPSSICNSKSIALSWSATSGATSYTLRRGSTAIYTGSNISYTDSVPANSTSYSYTLTSNAGGGSASVSASAISPNNCPPTVTGFTATPPSSPSCGSNWINISWYPTSTDASDTYVVKRGSTTIYSGDGSEYASGDHFAFSDTGLTLGSSHSYTLTYTNNIGTVVYNADPITPAVVQQMCVSNAPSNVVATANSQTQITLTWTDNSHSPSNESNFLIDRSTDSTSWSQLVSTLPNVTSYVHSNLIPNTTYHYRIRSTNAAGTSGYSNTASATTLQSAPSAPLGFTAAPGACGTGTIALSWSASSGATSYTLRRAGTVIYTGANTSFSDTGLTANTSYSYTLTASNSVGTSAAASASATAPQVCPPAAPSGLSATANSQTQITINWTDTSNNEAGFRVERSLNGSSGWTEITTTSAGATSYQNTGLSQNTAYYYRVRSTNAGGNSAYSNTAGATTLPSAPAAPTNFTATTSSACESKNITLSWTASSGATSYTVRRAGSVVYTGSGTSFIDTVPADNTSYSYTVTASNTGGISAASSVSGTSPGMCPPTATGFTATTPTNPTCSANWINISWYPTNATNYRITRGSTEIYDGNGSDRVVDDHFAFSDTGLTLGSSHTYTLSFTNAGGTTNVTANPSTPASVQQICSAPANFTATPSASCGSKTITLAWSASTGAISYTLKRGSTTIYTGSNLNYVDTVPADNTSYTYSLTSTNAAGESAAASASATSAQMCAASAPSGLTATASSQTQINLAWADNSTTETGFKVQRSANGSTGWTTITTTAAGATSYSNTGLTANTTYHYRVLSTNVGGDSAPSNTASATTLPNAPGAPGNFNAVPAACGTGTIDLSWNASSGATSYTLRRGTQTIYTGANTSFSDTGLTANTSYSYTLTASNSGGTSAAASDTATAPPNCTTLTFTADAVSVKFGGSTTLRWTPTNATSCTASGDWSGSKSPTGGSQSTGNINADKTYDLSCTGPGGTVERSVTVSAVPPSRINVNSNVQSADWTISGDNTSESITGSGNGNSGDLGPNPDDGTTYTIVPESISGYDFPPSITSSIGGGSSLLFFGGEHESFTISYARAFNYSLSNSGNITIEKGGFDQYGQVTIEAELTPDSGPSKQVSFSASNLPSGVSAAFSSCTPGGQPDCTSTLTLTVTPQAQSVTNRQITVTGSPLGRTTTFNLTIVNSPDMFVSCTPAPGSAKVGDTVRWTATVTQNPSRAPYTYSWAGSNVPPNTTGQSFDIVYSTTGSKTADATVRDNLGNIAHCIPVGTINIGVNPQFREI